jgi:tricorn protease
LFTKILLTVATLCIASTAAFSQTKLLRFPDIRGDRVVFTYAGDLWTAPSSGGSAVRLTSHPGVEVFGKFSPDGKWIAFTGQYDGDEQVYVVPTSGGEPRQLTFYPAKGPLAPRWGWDNQVFGWTKDSKRIIFRSLRDSWSLPIARLFSVSIDGGPSTAFQCRRRVPEIYLQTTIRLFIRHSRATFALRNVTAAARQISSTSST